MVVIRLARGGRTKQAVYRIVAADKQRTATGKFLAVLGSYNPHTKEVKIDKELTEKYLSNGAQPSDRALRILQSQKISTPNWAKTHDRFKKSKQVAEEAPVSEVKPEATPEANTKVVAKSADKPDDKQQSIDGPETAKTEAKIADDQKEATEKVAEAVQKTTDKS